MLAVASWYVALLILGVAGLLPSALLFERLESRGVHVARPVALAAVGLAAWLVVALGGVPYGTPVVFATVLALVAWSASIGWRRRDLVDALLARRRRILVGEGVFLALFALIVLVRVQAPDATGTEKPSDLMLLTAVHQSRELPPQDPWFAGRPLSYYHLGQVQADVVARLAGTTPDVAFNLATATAGAAAGVAALGLALDLASLGQVRRTRALVAGGVTAVGGLLFVAPLVGVVQVLAVRGIGTTWWGWLNVEGVPYTPDSNSVWWWPTSRVVPGAIDEYPGFTVVLGDPHSHLLALPLAITTLGFALVAFEGSTALTWRRWLRAPEQWVLTAALFAGLVMTNAWDVITFGTVWLLAAWWSASRAGWPLAQAGLVAIRHVAMAAGLALVLAWPFLQTLDTPAFGLVPVVDEHTSPLHWGLLWLPVLLPAIAALAILRPSSRPPGVVRAAAVLAAPMVIWAVWVAGKDARGLVERSWGSTTLVLLVIGGAACAGAASAVDRRHRAQGAAMCLIAMTALLLIATELFMLDDAFPGRLNTVFKFWFHAWALFAVAAAALVVLAVDRLGNSRPPATVLVAAGVCGVAWVASMVTTPAMALARADEFQSPGLSATAYLERVDPGLAAAAAWARAHLDPGGDILVEAIGEPYSSGNAMSVNSGVPTLLGWPGHERQWRGEIDEEARRLAVDAIYGEDRDAALAAAHEWSVTHVYVGRSEQAAYGLDVAERFDGWPVAFSSGDSVIFEVPAEMAS